MTDVMKGSCLCQGIQFECTGEVTSFSLCHCKMCRKFGGNAFGSFVGIRKSDFKYIKGEELLKIFRSSEWASRAFCSICGSSLMFLYDKTPDSYDVSAGAFDSGLDSRPTRHIFVKDKCSWFDITDDLEKVQKI